MVNKFQFHKGTIKTLFNSADDSRPAIRDFNSIKVRLKHRGTRARVGILLFQFHKGTIKTFVWKVLTQVLIVFQFHKGTIKTCCSWSVRWSWTISIP